jgi:hypothetical protein
MEFATTLAPATAEEAAALLAEAGAVTTRSPG